MKKPILFLVSSILVSACGVSTDKNIKTQQLVADDIQAEERPLSCPKVVASRAEDNASDTMADVAVEKGVLNYFYEVRKDEVLHELAYKASFAGADLRRLPKDVFAQLFVDAEKQVRKETEELRLHVDKLGITWTGMSDVMVDVLERNKKSPTRPQDVRTQFLKAFFFCDLSIRK